jgi:hypothetical protein
MTEEKKPGGQPQASQAQGSGSQPQSSQSKEGSKAQAQEPVNRVQEYYRQLGDAEAKLAQKKRDAWATYAKKTQHAATVYQDTVREIYDGARKASAPPPEEGKSPSETLEAYKVARSKNLHSAMEVNSQLLAAGRQYDKVCKSFWDDIVDSLSDAVNDFWDWINGWWEEPPVEGGGGGNPRRLADLAWRNAFENPAAAYYAGWNYGANLY